MRKDKEVKPIVKLTPPTTNPATGDSIPITLSIIGALVFGLLIIWTYGKGKIKNNV